jgi:lysophospholipase L1-like esterase
MKRLHLSFIFILILSFVSFAQTYERAKIWDKEIDSMTDFDKRQTPPENPVLFLGSSSIRGWYNLRESFPKLKIINRSFGGSRIEDTNHYFERIVTPYKPGTIVFYAGENDVNDGIAPEIVAAEYAKFAQKVRQKSPKTKIVYISLKPSPSRWKLADKFRQTNELIKTEIAKDKRSVFVSVWAAMLNEKGEPRSDLFQGDMLHLNSKGYEIWRTILSKYLK